MYDAIIVGARCAGSATAMLLARAGHRVLVVDRATFPSDTLSTHCITPGGVTQLQRWGLFDVVVATNTPHITKAELTLGAMTLPAEHPTGWINPRRTVLDKLLVDAARHAGAEVREGVTVKELKRDGDAVTGVTGRDPDGTPF